MEKLLTNAGFRILDIHDSTDESLDYIEATTAAMDESVSSPVTIQILFGDDFPQMIRNQAIGLRQRRIRTVSYICEALDFQTGKNRSRYPSSHPTSLGLEERKPTPTVTWNQIQRDHRDAIIELALDKPGFSLRELAVSCTDRQACFISESTIYCLPGELQRHLHRFTTVSTTSVIMTHWIS